MELPKTLLEQRREEYLEEKEKEKLEARDNGQKQAESVREWLVRRGGSAADGRKFWISCGSFFRRSTF